ncbi:MAG: transcriptional repressor [Bilifractor sp.]
MAALKYSRQREAIYNNLQHRKDHPTADMIFVDIRKEFPNISLGTVYRNLSLLSDLGKIQKLTADGIADRFDGNILPHDHFICQKCGAMMDMDFVDTERFKEEAARHFDGTIDRCSVIFYGTCPDCKQKEEAENEHSAAGRFTEHVKISPAS